MLIAKAEPPMVSKAAKTLRSGEASSSDKIPNVTNRGTMAAISP